MIDFLMLPVTFIRRAVKGHHPVCVFLLFRTQVGNGNVLPGVVAYQIPVVFDRTICPVYQIHAFFVLHGKPVDVYHVFKFLQYIGTLTKQFGVTATDNHQFVRCIVVIGKH